MPAVSARSKSSDSARMRLPSNEYLRRTPIADSVANPTPITIRSVCPILKPRKLDRVDDVDVEPAYLRPPGIGDAVLDQERGPRSTSRRS